VAELVDALDLGSSKFSCGGSSPPSRNDCIFFYVNYCIKKYKVIILRVYIANTFNMSRYRGPKIKIIRRLGELPGFTAKNTTRKYLPGQHGPVKANKKVSISEYSIKLQEKQKLRFNYGLSEKQLYSYVKESRRLKGVTGTNLLQLLEMRLDNIIYRLGIATTVVSARQFITHGNILVNNKRVNLPSFQCRTNDIISIKYKKEKLQLIQNTLKAINSNLLGSYLEFDSTKLIGKVKSLFNSEDAILKINELAIIEFYSRK